MMAVRGSRMLQPPSLIELLFRSFRASAQRHWPLLRHVQAIYKAVWPFPLSDADLCSFLSFLFIAVRVLRPRVVVQTGTAVGTSTVSIGLALRENGRGQLWTIDPEPPHYFGVDNPVAMARRVVRFAGLERQVHFVRGYSTMPLDAGRMLLPAAPTWQLTQLSLRTIDLLVIDGDHTFLGCYLDLVHGAAALSPSGPRAIVCHDYLGIPDVRKAVEFWRRSRQVRADRLVPSRCGIKFLQL